ncbi:MAG: DUF1318 domain-containing protein [Candidatus Omnitrophica bacterium]|nr:DUF1318 domain-containing protein [Candidatus Omnitrophota bacterium]
MKKILSVLMLSLFISGIAFAGEYDLKTITPTVKNALDGRRDRYAQLEQLKNQDKVGEGRDGFVVNLNGDAEADPVVTAENQDRSVIYSAIVQQNDLPETEIRTVARVFAETQRQKAKAGQMIQLETGAWAKKK